MLTTEQQQIADRIIDFMRSNPQDSYAWMPLSRQLGIEKPSFNIIVEQLIIDGWMKRYGEANIILLRHDGIYSEYQKKEINKRKLIEYQENKQAKGLNKFIKTYPAWWTIIVIVITSALNTLARLIFP